MWCSLKKYYLQIPLKSFIAFRQENSWNNLWGALVAKQLFPRAHPHGNHLRSWFSSVANSWKPGKCPWKRQVPLFPSEDTLFWPGKLHNLPWSYNCSCQQSGQAGVQSGLQGLALLECAGWIYCLSIPWSPQASTMWMCLCFNTYGRQVHLHAHRKPWVVRTVLFLFQHFGGMKRVYCLHWRKRLGMVDSPLAS